jgi:dTDP-4-amino-4,6-dideoxygalactose transaminase
MTNTFTFFKGRIALHAILKAADIGKGDRVLLPGYTCIVVPNAILYRGAEPVYVDIEPHTYNLDPSLLEAKLKEAARGTYRAVIVQHTYGIPCDMVAIARIAREHDLLVIEDSCHTLGSKFNDQCVGTFGDAAFFSSQWSKPVTTGLGGWAVANNPVLQRRLELAHGEYTQPSRAESLLLALQLVAFRVAYRPRLFWLVQGVYRKMAHLGLAIGSSSSPELECVEPPNYMKAMGHRQVSQLKTLLDKKEADIETRRHHARVIRNRLRESGFATVDLPTEYDPVFVRYPVLVENREQVLNLARKHKVQLGDWFLSPVHPNETGWTEAGYKAGSCPIAEEISRRVVNISTDARTSAREIERTIAFLRQHATPYVAGQTMKMGEN